MIIEKQVFKYQGKVIIEKVTIQPPFRHDYFLHNERCFIYFKEASVKVMSVELNDELKSNEAVLLQCGAYLEMLHDVGEKNVEAIAVHLYPETLKKLYINDLSELITKRKTVDETKIITSEDIITEFIESLEFYFNHPSLVNDDLLELKIKELVLLLIQTKNIDAIVDLVTEVYTSNSINIKNVVELHLYSNLSLEELAKLCHLSVSSFKREFKKEFNDTPKSYMNQRRIEEAKKLLVLPNMSISDIAYELGFNDPLYFTRLFKNKTGSSPSAYKKKNTKQ